MESKYLPKISLDNNRLLGAIGVLENYIVGALADYENGDIDDEHLCCLEDSVYVYTKLEQVMTLGFSLHNEYEERLARAKEKRKCKEGN